MKSHIRRLWRLSWIVTLPVTLVFFLWFQRTYERYENFGLRQFTPDQLTLRRSGQLELDHMAASLQVEANALGLAERLQRTGLRTVSLFVKEGNLQQLNSDLPVSGAEYVDGGLSTDGSAVQEVDVRYRGDSVYHWAYWKKSWRVKTKKDELFMGMRKFNLIATRSKNLLNNHFAYRLANHMGLISPYSEVVNVVLNGKLLGVYILTEQLDESTIRRHDKMPGDVYSGDIAGRDRYKGHSVDIFDQPGAWTKVAVNNHFDLAALDPLEEFLFYFHNAHRSEGQAGLSELLDADAVGRYLACDILFQTYHADNSHNWRFYYDPWKTKLEPVIWDPMGWMQPNYKRTRFRRAPDILMSDMHVALLSNPDFLRARHRALAEFFDSGKDKLFLTEARNLVERMELAIEADPNFVFLGEHLDPQDTVEATSFLVEFIESVFAEIHRVHLVCPNAVTQYARLDENTIRLNVSGRGPVNDLELTYDVPLQGPVEVSISCYSAAGEEIVDVSGATTLSGTTVRIKSDLVARPEIGALPAGRGTKLRMATGSYDINVKTKTQNARLLHVQARRGLGNPMRMTNEVKRLQKPMFWPTVNVVNPAPIQSTTTYSADVVIAGNRVIENDLVIEPGTRLLFEPGANLLVKGRVSAKGTRANPIHFGPLQEGQDPWGTFAIKGPDADGSHFAHCHFREGSGWKEPLAEYSAMFSIHHVQAVRVEHCTFQDSRIVDDMVHGVYSEVVFRNCRFVRSLFDALDMDISTVEVVGCEFIESGNDAVDLMTARAKVHTTQFLSSVDKGISVGEDSALLVQDTLFESCEIAVQTKDRSTATLINCDLLNCNLGVDGIRKNWRYGGGGEAFIYKSNFSGCNLSLGADSSSRLFVRDSYIDDIDSVKRKRVDVGENVDSLTPYTAAQPKLERDERELDALGDIGVVGRGTVRPRKRGSRYGASAAKRARKDS